MPTFGAWRDLGSAALRTLAERRLGCFLPELSAFWQKTWLPLLGKNEGDLEKELIPLRNYLCMAAACRTPGLRSCWQGTAARSRLLCAS